ncbi:putative cullin [Helianthus debilis subsp. tardiflorus]
MIVNNKYDDLGQTYNSFHRVQNGLTPIRHVVTSHIQETCKQTVIDPEQYFINSNSRSSNFISLFVDDKLRKGFQCMSEADLEVVLDKVMTFRYLQEKDVFEKYYKQHLTKRLLSGISMYEDAERSLILKLKIKCGYQFTSKLEGMFSDMKTSQDIMQGFYDSTRQQSFK